MQQGSWSLAVLCLVHLENSCKILTNVRPQENGSKLDIRWMSLTDSDGAGFIAVGMPNIDVSGWHYTMADLEKAKHIHELPQCDLKTFNLAYKQIGIGGDNSWGTRTHPEYTLPAKTYSYFFRLTPYGPTLGDIHFLVPRGLLEVN